MKYDITKSENEDMFFENAGLPTFNTSYFTKLTLKVIEKIYRQVCADTFIVNGLDKNQTMEKLKKQVEKLKNYSSGKFQPINNLTTTSTTTTQTTSSIG
ncbi:MAG: hypothetical protein RIB86_11725 [Imperialibacter sp.]